MKSVCPRTQSKFMAEQKLEVGFPGHCSQATPSEHILRTPRGTSPSQGVRNGLEAVLFW